MRGSSRGLTAEEEKDHREVDSDVRASVPSDLLFVNTSASASRSTARASKAQFPDSRASSPAS